MGSDRRICELMTRLSTGNQVDFLVIPSFRESTGLVKPSAKGNCNNRNGYNSHAEISVHRFELPRVVNKLWTKSFYLGYFLSMIILELRIIRRLLKSSPEVVVINYPSVYTGLLGFLAAKLLRKVCVTDFSDLIAQYTIELLNLHESRFASNALVLIQNLIVKKSDGVLAVTSYVRNYALRIGTEPSKIEVVPNGCDLDVFDHTIRSNYRIGLVSDSKKVCMYCGRLDTWAGSRIITQIAKKLQDNGDDTTFVVVGNQVQDTFDEHNIVTIDEVDQAELPKMMSIADVMIVPFPKNEVSDAASPIKLFEAMAMQKAVVASCVAGIREVITDGLNGVLVEPDNVDQWVDKILEVLGSPETCLSMRQKALETVKEKYQWQQLAHRTEAFLNKILLQEKKERFLLK
jgi:glycosyltransferase involved in cell wall biosynthesis